MLMLVVRSDVMVVQLFVLCLLHVKSYLEIFLHVRICTPSFHDISA